MDAYGDRISHALQLEADRRHRARRHLPWSGLVARLARLVTTARSWIAIAP